MKALRHFLRGLVSAICTILILKFVGVIPEIPDWREKWLSLLGVVAILAIGYGIAEYFGELLLKKKTKNIQ